MSSDWQPLKVGDLFNLVNGYAFKSSEFIEQGVPVIKIKNVKAGYFSEHEFSYVHPENLQSRKEKIAKVNDLLISMSGNRHDGSPETWVGKVAFFNKKNDYLINQRVGALRVKDRNVCNERFASYVLSSISYQNLFISIATSSGGQANLSPSQIFDAPFLLPPIESQISISDTLGSLDDRIALLRETNETLEAIAQAIFKSWFVDFDPVRAKARGNQPEGMDATTAALFPDSFEETEFGLVPKGWTWCSLKDVTSIFDSKRIPLSGAEREARKGIYPYYGAAALMDYVNDFIFDGIYLLTGEDGSVSDNDGFPITQYVWGKFWVNNHAHILQGKNGISTEHLMLALRRTNVKPFITGAVQAKLSQGNLWKINFLKSTDSIATAFSKILDPLYEKVRHANDEIKMLTDLRDTLLPRLISGRLSLSGAK